MGERELLRWAETEQLLATVGAERAEHEGAEVIEAEGRLSVLAEKPITPAAAALRREAHVAIVIGLLFLASAFGGARRIMGRFMQGDNIVDVAGALAMYGQLIFGLGLFTGGILFSRGMEAGRRILIVSIKATAAFILLIAFGGAAYGIHVHGISSRDAWTIAVFVPVAVVLAVLMNATARHFASGEAKEWCRRESADDDGDVTALGGIELIINVGTARADNERSFVEKCEAEIRRRAAKNWPIIAESFRKARSWLIVFGLLYGLMAACGLLDVLGDRDAAHMGSLVTSSLVFCAGAGLLVAAAGINRRRRWGRHAIITGLVAFIGIASIPILSAASGGFRSAAAGDILGQIADSLGMLAFFGAVFFLLWKYFTSWKARLWCRG